MDFKVVWTEPALSDLEELVRFIAEDDPAAAVRIGDEIVDHVELLKSFPEIGPLYRRRPVADVRQITCRSCRIFCRLRRDQQLVEVLHVWHGARRDPEDLG